MVPKRSTACTRFTQPRSQATMVASAPNPEAPQATGPSRSAAPRVRRSNARPLTGCAPSQKYRNVCRCTRSSSSLSASLRATERAPRVLGLWRRMVCIFPVGHVLFRCEADALGVGHHLQGLGERQPVVIIFTDAEQTHLVQRLFQQALDPA